MNQDRCPMCGKTGYTPETQSPAAAIQQVHDALKERDPAAYNAGHMDGSHKGCLWGAILGVVLSLIVVAVSRLG